MKLIIAISSCIIIGIGLGVATPVTAQLDPDPDGLGFYADLDGFVNHVNVPINTPLQIYLLHTRCSASSGVSAWECTVGLTGHIIVLGWNPVGGYINFNVPPEFEVGIYPPLPWAPAILLMDVWLMVQDLAPCYLSLSGGPLNSLGDGLPVFAVGDNPEDLRTIYPSSGDVNLPVFAINGQAPIAVVNSTWGEVKNLYGK